MDGIDQEVIQDYIINERKAAIDRVRTLSRCARKDNPCLNRTQIRALCDHFKVKSLAEVFRLIDATE